MKRLAVKISFLLMAIVLLFSLMGCVDIIQRVEVNEDGSGTIKLTIAMDKAVLEQSDTENSGMGDPAAAFDIETVKASITDETIIVEPLTDDSKVGYSVSTKFANPEDLNAAMLKLSEAINSESTGPSPTSNGEMKLEVDKGILKTTWKLTTSAPQAEEPVAESPEISPEDIGLEDSPELQENLNNSDDLDGLNNAMSSMFNIQMQVVMPGKITETNGTTNEEKPNEVSWDTQKITEVQTISVTSEKTNMVVIIAGIAGISVVVLGIIGVVVFIVIKKKKNGLNVPKEPKMKNKKEKNNLGLENISATPEQSFASRDFNSIPTAPENHFVPQPQVTTFPAQQMLQQIPTNSAPQPQVPTSRRIAMIQNTNSAMDGVSIITSDGGQTFMLENGQAITAEQIKQLHQMGRLTTV